MDDVIKNEGWRPQTIVRGYPAMPIEYIHYKQLIVSMLLLLDIDYNLGLLC